MSEEDSYESKPSITSPVLQHPLYPETSVFSQTRTDLDQRLAKRPRVTSEISSPSLRDAWSYTSAMPSNALYSNSYSPSYSQNIPQTFAHSSQPYTPTNNTFQNLVSYPRAAQQTYWPGQPRTDPLSMGYRYYSDDPVRQI